MATQRSTRTQPTPKPHDAGATRETDTATPRDEDDDPKAELRALDEAWRGIIDARVDDALAAHSLVSLLFAAVTGGPYEGAEADSPAVAVLTGDLIADVLGGLRAFVDGLDQDAAEGGGSRAVVYGHAIEARLRKVDSALALRHHERIHRERLAQTIAGGAP